MYAKYLGQTYNRKNPLDVADWQNGMPVPFPVDDPEVMSQISWVYACVRIISEAGIRVPWAIYRGKSDQPVEGTPLEKLLKQPNPFMSGRELFKGTFQWLELHGNAYWFLDDYGKFPGKIWLLDSRYMQVVPDKQEFIRAYVYTVNGNQIPIPREQIIHFRRFNPFSPFYGMGTLQAIRGTVEVELLRRQFDRKFYENGAILSGVIETPEAIPEDEYKRIEHEWRKMHRGAKNAYKTAVLANGATYKPVTISQKDMEFLESAKFKLSEILAAFGVPPSKLGLMEDANRANSSEQDKTFLSETMEPKLKELEEKINNELAPLFGDYRFEFEPIAKDDEQDKVNMVVALAPTGVLTTDELREILGYGPMENRPLEAPQSGGNDGGNGIGTPQNDAQKAFKSVADTFQRSRTAYLAIHRKRWREQIAQFFSEQEKRVLARLFAATSKPKAIDPNTFVFAELWLEQIENGEIEKALMPIYLEVAQAAYEKAGFFFDRDIRFDAGNAKHRDIILNLAKKVTRVNETTKKMIAEQVRLGLERGYSIQKIAYGDPGAGYKGVAGVFEDARGRRAETIARSETADAYNLANLLAYKEMNQTKVLVLDGVDWDEDCRKANGSIWTIEKAEMNPKEHPNCTRAFAPYIELDGLSLGESIMKKGGERWAERVKKKLFARFNPETKA